MRIGLVGCVKTKVSHAAQARDLYVSTLFRGRRAFVEVSCDRWFVLSAKHGLLPPNEVIDPYEQTLKGSSTDTKRRWATMVLRQIDETAPDYPNTTFEFHAGADYRSFGLVDGLRSHGATVEVPTEHLSQGNQLTFYAGATARTTRPPTLIPGASRTSPPRRGSYTPLADHLENTNAAVVHLSFLQIEQVLGRPLPASARRHRAWWANESSGTHSHAAAWVGVGWVINAIDLNSSTVSFGRRHR